MYFNNDYGDSMTLATNPNIVKGLSNTSPADDTQNYKLLSRVQVTPNTLHWSVRDDLAGAPARVVPKIGGSRGKD